MTLWIGSSFLGLIPKVVSALSLKTFFNQTIKTMNRTPLPPPSASAIASKRNQENYRKQQISNLLNERKDLVRSYRQNTADLIHIGHDFPATGPTTDWKIKHDEQKIIADRLGNQLDKREKEVRKLRKLIASKK